MGVRILCADSRLILPELGSVRFCTRTERLSTASLARLITVSPVLTFFRQSASCCSARVATGSAAGRDDEPVEAVTMALFSLLVLNGVVAAGTADDAGSLISQA